MNQVEEMIIHIIEEYATDEVTVDSALFPLGISSFNIMKIVVQIEKYFQIKVDEKKLDLSKFYCVNDIVKRVESELEKLS